MIHQNNLINHLALKWEVIKDNFKKGNNSNLFLSNSVTLVSVNYEDKDIFVIGCDSGGLFKCSFSSLKKATPSKKKISKNLK